MNKTIQTDFVIAGGGVSGVVAALAAARNGARVVLVQDRSMLGGNASSEIRMHMVGASCSGRRPGARESGIIEELRLADAVGNAQRSPSMFDLLLYDKVRSEERITLLLDTVCTGCEMKDGRIVAVLAERNWTEDTFRIEAPLFADCTGDGRLGAEAGADFRMGREASSEYNEPHAPAQADGKTLGSTILFMARKHATPQPFTAPAWARKFTAADLRLREHREYEYGYWWLEWGGELNAIADGDAIRNELLAIAMGVWDHVKNHCDCDGREASAHDLWREGIEMPVSDGAANWALEWIGMLPGKRESRRFLGPTVLTESDIVEARLPQDTVAYGGWWIDLHPPAGVYAAAEFPCEQVAVPYVYGIPFGTLYSRNVPNLFFAGRNISATHVAFASTRVMATCALVGQAVGTAAALATQHGLDNAAAVHARIGELQQTLIRQDAWLPGVRGCDAGDLARTANITASSGDALAIVDGETRATTTALHPTLDDSTHQWRSEELPAWVELTWPEPRTIREVRITFDTGLERELTLTQNNLLNSRMIRGPQPETVRAYRLTAGGRTLAEVNNNHERLRVHRLDAPITAPSLRLEITATHGAPCARVFEIRVYG